ncbi:MAG: hydroxyethylthiazole kinase [Deltaproteobacteria bacterium]|nr:hydroxyethylthiazole kinase [Deltaproteobacteria bacterium]
MPSKIAFSPSEKLQRVRDKAPLVHNITNYVVMNSTANALLAAGASPVMAHAPEEVADMVGLASALVLNIGTLSAPWIDAMLLAGRAANAKGIPVVLDPVGCGATPFRTETTERLLGELRIAVLRGNASEVLSCTGCSGRTKGVDSTVGSLDVVEAAREIARKLGCTVAVTGKVDVVTDGAQTLLVSNGHPMLSRVTGTGCAATAIVGAFCGAGDDPVSDAASALAFFGFAGERAATSAAGPGSFWVAMLDELSRVRPSDLAVGARIERAP